MLGILRSAGPGHCLVVLLFLLYGGQTARAQSPAARTAAVRPPFAISRQDEDWRFLRDPARRHDLWDPLKYVPLDANGRSYLSFGGEVRERFEMFRNPLWGAQPTDGNGYLLQRVMLHADGHIGDRFRAFVQLKSGAVVGSRNPPRPVDRDQADLHQGFVDAVVGPSARPVTVRIGRQELAFGSQRLVSVREGPNIRQSFDGVRVIVPGKRGRLDAFAVRPTPTNPRAWDDRVDARNAFWGVYGTGPAARIGNLDLYYLVLQRRQAIFAQGRAGESRHSIGGRVWGRAAGWDWNTEAVYQFGRFGSGTISAWTLANDTGYTWRRALWSPRLSLKADIASGDSDPRKPTLNTFNALFPRGAYFNEAALIGPGNFIDLHPAIETHPSARLSWSIDDDFLWRQSPRDGLYGVSVNLVRSPGMTRARYVGDQWTSTLSWQADRHTTLVGTCTHFHAGPFLRESGPGRDVDYISSWVTYRF